MFKEENRIWWYLIGIVIVLILFLLFARGFLRPFLGGETISFEKDYQYREPDEVINIGVDENEIYQVNFYTNKGIFVARVYPRIAPQNVNSFIFLAKDGYYDETKFHRVFSDFLIQGGDRNTLDSDPANDGKGNPGYLVKDEVNWDALNLSEKRRIELRALGYETTDGLESRPLARNALAMANSGPNTNGSQFFIVIAEQDDPRLEKLNGRFTVIGEIISGMDVIKNISRVPVELVNEDFPRPTEPVYIEKVEVEVI